MIENFSGRLRRYRQSLGVSGKQFASMVGLSYSSYMNYESRQNFPPADVLCRIADVLGVTTDQLLGRRLDNWSVFTQAGFTVKPYTDSSTGKNVEMLEITDKKDGSVLFNVSQETAILICNIVDDLKRVTAGHDTVYRLLTTFSVQEWFQDLGEEGEGND